MSWKRKVSKPLEIVFKFDGARNFSKVNIFSSNLFHLNVQVKNKKIYDNGMFLRKIKFQNKPSGFFAFLVLENNVSIKK